MSTLTGESQPVAAPQRPAEGTGIEASDRVFAGTYVTAGAAEAVVVTTGMAYRARAHHDADGRARSATTARSSCEMQRMTRVVALLSVSLGAAFFLLAGTLGMGPTERFLFAIGVIVANVPEGLLPTVTLSLALATQRMARRNAIVRRLSAVETLGETTVICTDKTGTLTENQMTVTRVWLPSGELDVEGAGYAPEGALRTRAGAPATRGARGAGAGRRALQRRRRSSATATSGGWWAIRPRARCSRSRTRRGSTSTPRRAATRASTSTRSTR